MVPTSPVYTYAIDPYDRISFVSPEWVQFAEQNDAEELQPDAVLGRLIWPYIDGSEAQDLYGVLFSKIREDGRVRTVPFRCDGPHCRRYMTLTLRSLGGGALELSSVLLQEEPRDPVSLLDAATPRSQEFLVMCAWCKRLPLGEEWLEVEEAVAALDLFGAARLPAITHGMCPTCRASLFESGSP